MAMPPANKAMPAAILIACPRWASRPSGSSHCSMQAIASVEYGITGGKMMNSARSGTGLVMRTLLQFLWLLVAPSKRASAVGDNVPDCLHWRHMIAFAAASRGDNFRLLDQREAGRNG